MNKNFNRINSIFKLLRGKNDAAELKLKELEEQTQSIAWYPSAGLDFRDILELSNSNYTEEKPDLFIHTDYNPDWNIENSIFETFLVGAIRNNYDENYQANIENVYELELTEDINYFVDGRYVDFSNYAPETPKVFLLNVTVSHLETIVSKPVLYFVFENINFLEEVLLKHKISITYFIKVREGFGFGGNRKSISIVYAFLAKLEVKYLFVDDEEHTDFSLVNRIRKRNKIDNISSEIQYVNCIDRWSGLKVNVFKAIADHNLQSTLNKIKEQRNCRFNISNYFKNQFPIDLKTIEFQHPNVTLLNNPNTFKIDNNTIYFGGINWKNFNNDIRHIERNNYDFFFLSLFMISVFDLTMYTHFRTSYDTFRSLTYYPKFGWSGLGPHYENPKKILSIPENRGFLEKRNVVKFIDNYIDMFIDEFNSFFENKTPQITSTDFLTKLLNDSDFHITNSDEDSIFELIYNKLNRRLA